MVQTFTLSHTKQAMILIEKNEKTENIEIHNTLELNLYIDMQC